MDQTQSPFAQLVSGLNTADPSVLLTLCKQLTESFTANPALTITQIVLLIKNNESATALQQISQLTKEMKQQQLQFTPQQQEILDYAKMYAQYKEGNFNQIVEDVNKKKSPSIADKVLLAQAYGRLEKNSQMVDVYQQLLNEPSLANELSEIYTNIVYGAVISQDQQLIEKVSKLAQEFLKKKKFSRDLILNLSFLYLQQNNIPSAKEQIFRFQNMLKLEAMQLENDEDHLISSATLDYIQFLENNQSDSTEKIANYEKYLELKNLPQSVSPVFLNNLACLQERLNHNHHDTLKRIEEALSLPVNKYSPLQLTQLKFNRIIVQICRNRLSDALKNLKEIESSFASKFDLNLIKFVQAVKNKTSLEQISQQIMQSAGSNNEKFFAFLFISQQLSETPIKIIEVFKQINQFLPKWQSNRIICIILLGTMMKLDQDFPDIINQIEIPREVCSYYLKRGKIEESLKAFEKCSKEDEDLKGQIALLFIEKGLWQKAEQFLDQIPFPFQLLNDLNELERLEKNVGLSKQRTKSGDFTDQVEKKIKKKKRRKHPRYLPKGFDKTNPGPQPNPERWLPKFERKDYKKRKGAQLKSRTQGSAQGVGKETMNVFSQGATSANVDVSSKAKKNKKKK